MRRLAKLLLALGVSTALLPVVVLTMRDTPEHGTEVRAGLATGTPTSADIPAPTALHRCRDLGRAALDDAICLALWAETRRRFLGGGDDAEESGSTTGDARTTTPDKGSMDVSPRDGARDTDRPVSSPAR